MLTKNTEILRAEVAAHIAADAVMQGNYWRKNDNAVGGRGCFIGCLSHSEEPRDACERFGLTEPIMRIAEDIFENLPSKEAVDFFAELPGAVGQDGKDLSLVHWQFMASELRDLPPQPDAAQKSIDVVIDGMERLARGGAWPHAEAANAAKAAADAVKAADAATYAARAAYAAARAAEAATYAAEAATYAANAAYAAARAAARTANATAGYRARRRQRDLLRRLIAEAPVTTIGV